MQPEKIDASEYSNGSVLSQIQNGREHPIAYGGRSLRGSELKWHITDKETLTLVEGIQHFKHYLVNNEFTVYTDNVSVKYLQKIKDFQGRLGQWSLLLQGYNFRIEHRAGTKNTADCLSSQQYRETEPTSSTDLGEHLYNLDLSDKEYTETTLFYKGEGHTVHFATSTFGLLCLKISNATYRLAKFANNPNETLELNDHHYNPSQVVIFLVVGIWIF